MFKLRRPKLSGNPASVQLESNATTQIYTQKLQIASIFQTFFCVALHFVKERVAYSISNFSDFKFNTAIYNKDLKYASVFKFFFATALRLCCIALHCSNATSNLHCLQHCVAGCNFSSYC